MSRILLPKFGWGGLNTRANATGLPLLECTVLQDMRVVGRDLVQRLGISRVQQLTGNMKAMDFDGANQHCSNSIDTRVWALGFFWTVEVCIELDVTTGTQGIFTAGHTTPSVALEVTGGNLVAHVWDNGGAETSVTVGAATTAKQSVQITRSGATISTKLDNGTAVTGAISATLTTRTPVGDLRVARDTGTNYMNGTVCYLRAFSIVKTNHADRLIRLPCPRASYVLADYDFNESAANLVYDRSRYENHLITQNGPGELAALCHNPAPIRGVSMSRNTETNRAELLVPCGGLYYLGATG